MALLFSSYWGKLDCVRLLLESGADIKAVDRNNSNALMLAVTRGCHLQDSYDNGDRAEERRQHIDIIRLLLEHGCQANEVNFYHKTPLITACSGEDIKVVKILLEFFRLKDLELSTPFRDYDLELDHNLPQIFTESRKIWHRRCTPLTMAVQRENVILVKMLLEAKVPIDEGAQDDSTALHYAAECEDTEIMKLLIATGADVNKLNYRMRSPLECACSYRNEEALFLLLKNGAIIPVKHRTSDRSFFPGKYQPCVMCEVARFASDEAMLAICELMKGHEDENCVHSPLWKAVISGNMLAARFLIKYGCKLRIEDKPLLIKAVKKMRVDDLRLLCMGGVFKSETLTEMYTDIQLQEYCADRPEVMQMLEKFACHPQSLMHICRNTLRDTLKSPLPNTVTQLFLPAPLVQFLLYSDIIE